ncbi:hypothetical protein, partial [Mycoplasmopsis arginini]
LFIFKLMEELKQYVVDVVKSHPQHEEEIKGLYYLCLDEIEQGGSVEHEISLCRSDIEELIC